MVSIMTMKALMDNMTDMRQTTAYSIRLNGSLDASWLDWFNGFSVILQIDGTALVGILTNQAGLYDLLSRIDSSNLPLISLNRLPQQCVPESIMFHGLTPGNPAS